ncbi:unnamed protein product [Amoebophrya sp. A25]|nr:unnamed protein product [Amoebophrya sp. A25]|eukprot:GSA25T00009986001.1
MECALQAGTPLSSTSKADRSPSCKSSTTCGVSPPPDASSLTHGSPHVLPHEEASAMKSAQLGKRIEIEQLSSCKKKLNQDTTTTDIGSEATPEQGRSQNAAAVVAAAAAAAKDALSSGRASTSGSTSAISTSSSATTTSSAGGKIQHSTGAVMKAHSAAMAAHNIHGAASKYSQNHPGLLNMKKEQQQMQTQTPRFSNAATAGGQGKGSIVSSSTEPPAGMNRHLTNKAAALKINGTVVQRGTRFYDVYGWVRMFNPNKGWGFILCNEFPGDVFLHTKHVKGDCPLDYIGHFNHATSAGARLSVCFDLDFSNDVSKPQALNVRLCSENKIMKYGHHNSLSSYYNSTKGGSGGYYSSNSKGSSGQHYSKEGATGDNWSTGHPTPGPSAPVRSTGYPQRYSNMDAHSGSAQQMQKAGSVKGKGKGSPEPDVRSRWSAFTPAKTEVASASAAAATPGPTASAAVATPEIYHAGAASPALMPWMEGAEWDPWAYELATSADPLLNPYADLTGLTAHAHAHPEGLLPFDPSLAVAAAYPDQISILDPSAVNPAVLAANASVLPTTATGIPLATAGGAVVSASGLPLTVQAGHQSYHLAAATAAAANTHHIFAANAAAANAAAANAAAANAALYSPLLNRANLVAQRAAAANRQLARGGTKYSPGVGQKYTPLGGAAGGAPGYLLSAPHAHLDVTNTQHLGPMIAGVGQPSMATLVPAAGTGIVPGSLLVGTMDPTLLAAPVDAGADSLVYGAPENHLAAPHVMW